MKGSPNPRSKRIDHLLNISKSKSSYSFQKAQRFIQDKNYSPNKFYDIPSTLSRRTSTIGFGNKTSFERNDAIEPTRYRIVSDFDKSNNKTPKFTTFGINREEYYKGRSSSNALGPGSYQISQNSKQSGGYMGSRLERPSQKHNISAATYDISEMALNKLSTYRKNEITCRMKTEYFPKPKFSENDTCTPGPGAYYHQKLGAKKASKSNLYNFGKEQRIKKDKSCITGPGSYFAFSQFD